MMHLKISLDVQRHNNSDLFRSLLNYHLKEKSSKLFGTIDRSTSHEVKISAYWMPFDHSRILECFAAAAPWHESIEETVNNESVQVNLSKTPPVWKYNASKDSPRPKVWTDSFLATDDIPLDDVPEHEAPSDIESQGTQTAHIVSKNDYKKVGLWLIAKATNDKTAVDWYRRFESVTLTMPFTDHTNYDRLHFFFGWRAYLNGSTYSILLNPAIVKLRDGENDYPLADYTLEEVLPTDLEIYLHSFVLRKYITLIIRRKLSCFTAFKKDWESPPLRSDAYDE
jgi:hypothetical protein